MIGPLIWSCLRLEIEEAYCKEEEDDDDEVRGQFVVNDQLDEREREGDKNKSKVE